MKKFTVINDSAVQLGKQTINADDLVENLYDSIGQYILTGKIQNSSNIGKVLYKQLKSIDSKLQETDNLKAVKDLMDITKETSNYYQRKQAQDADFTEYLLYKNLFEWQRQVWNDNSKRKALICGRRSGKSYLVAVEMLRHCCSGVDNIKDSTTGLVIKKNRQACYIGLTQEKAASIMWQPIKDLMEKCHISYSRIDNGQHIIEFSNGNSLFLYGNNSKAEREKLRGKDCSAFFIDEVQSQQGVGYLLESIVGPIVAGRNGEIWLAGTAPLNAATYWESVINGNEGYSVYKATMADNPSIPDCSNALNKVLVENHWTEDNVTYRREYLGEICYDTERMIYPVRSYYDNIPNQKVKNIWIGVDFGWTHATAFAPIVCLENGECYLVNEFKQAHMTSSSIIAELNSLVETLSKKYNIDYNQVHVRCDVNEGSIIADIQNQFPRMDIHRASKRGEAAQIALVNDSLRSGLLRIVKDNYFDKECNILSWKTTDGGTILYGQIDEDGWGNNHMDMSDAVKYAVSSMYRDDSYTKQVEY